MREWSRRVLLPWLMWGGAVGGASALWCGMQRVSASGHVVSVEYSVSTPRAGRVAELTVEVGDYVRAGEIVATLDAAEIDAELAILAAERQRLKAQLGAAKVGAEARESATTRELDQSLSAAELALRAAKSRRQVKSAELAVVGSQVRRLKDLVDQRIADRRALDDLLVQQASARQEVEAADVLIAQLVGEVASARGRRGGVDLDAPEAAVEPLRAELEILDRREDLLELRRAELVLRAPNDGEVGAVLVRPGEVVGAGAPVLTLNGSGGPRIQVCVSEAQADQVRVGEAVTLHRPGRGREPLSGRVSSIRARVALLPTRCWRNPQMPEWGREVTVAVDEPTALVGGQSFRVTFLGELADDAITPEPEAPPVAAPVDPTPSPRPAPAVASATDRVAPLAMVVPVALAERTRLEPSGLLWWPALGRFLLISDDTGIQPDSEHVPWLFTLRRSGDVDPEPLQLEGVEEVSDLEAIAPGPEDSVYVLASQSLSAKGKRPAARQLFARVAIGQGGGRVTGAVHLADLLAAGGAEVLEALGVPDLSALDLEGMTATHEGGLLIGLKAPLGARGEALIWRLARPDRLFAGEGLTAAGLTLWGSVPLRVRADGSEVPGGIADLLELPDQTLLLGATASGIDPTEQSGSLWHVGGRARLAVPRKIREFDGLKPEGLALSPDGAAIVVVFDTGDETPRWLEIPWPAR